jgi:hypothetical protein
MRGHRRGAEATDNRRYRSSFRVAGDAGEASQKGICEEFGVDYGIGARCPPGP